MRDSFIIYRSFYEAIKDLPPDNQLEMYNAICEYSLNLVEPELSGLSKTIFTLIKPQLDANIQRFKNGKNPKKKRNESETEANDKQTESKTEANNNVNVNNNVNNNPKENDIEKRKLKFADTLKPFLGTYDKTMLNDFYKYWTEQNKSNTKFKQELEKTWSLERRLEVWASRDKNFTKEKPKETSLAHSREFK